MGQAREKALREYTAQGGVLRLQAARVKVTKHARAATRPTNESRLIVPHQLQLDFSKKNL
jgi:hypothetical protein